MYVPGEVLAFQQRYVCAWGSTSISTALCIFLWVPVVEVLVHDGVAGVPTKGHVPHREELQCGLPCHCPGHQGSLEQTIMLGKIYQQGFNLFISDSILLSFMHFGKKRFPSSHSLKSCSSII